MSGKMVDAQGKPVEGLPDSYDNVLENGEMLYLDEERLARKERPEKPVSTITRMARAQKTRSGPGFRFVHGTFPPTLRRFT